MRLWVALLLLIMVTCSARNCKNTTQNSKGVSFFRFPPNTLKHIERRELWARNCGRDDLRPEGAEYRLCEQHFENDQIKRRQGSPRLVTNAVPTIFNITVHKPTDTMFTNNICRDHAYARGMTCPGGKYNHKMLLQELEIKNLREKLKIKNRNLKSANKTIKRLNANHEKTKAGLNGLFGEDQFKRLTKKNYRGYKWSLETIQKSLRLRFACKTKGYRFLMGYDCFIMYSSKPIGVGEKSLLDFCPCCYKKRA